MGFFVANLIAGRRKEHGEVNDGVRDFCTPAPPPLILRFTSLCAVPFCQAVASVLGGRDTPPREAVVLARTLARYELTNGGFEAKSACVHPDPVRSKLCIIYLMH